MRSSHARHEVEYEEAAVTPAPLAARDVKRFPPNCSDGNAPAKAFANPSIKKPEADLISL
jgi:hypothetical protein